MVRSGWHRVQAQGWRRLTDAKLLKKLGTLVALPPARAHLPLPPSVFLLPSDTDSFT